jgi:IclR family acetate operon transcriptional repressor
MSSLATPSPIRPLQVLDAFRVARRPLSLSEMARLAGLPVSTCHGVVRTLERHGFLYFLSSREAYPTRRLWDMASVIEANDPVAHRLAPALGELRDQTGETVIVGTHQNGQVLYLAVVESPQSIRYSSRAGEHKPLHSSSIGKCLLGSMAEPELDRWLAENSLVKVTGNTITEQSALKAELQLARKRGCYVTQGENVADVMGVAAPLQLGSLTLGIAVAGPLHRMQPDEARIAPLLLDCVRRLSNEHHELNNV